MVFPFFPVPYHRVYVASCFFGHVLATWNPNILGAGRLELFCLTEVCDQALIIEMTTLSSSNSHVLRSTDFKSDESALPGLTKGYEPVLCA